METKALWECLGDLPHFRFAASFLVLQSLPLLREIPHDQSPLEISSGGVATNGVVILDMTGGDNQSLYRRKLAVAAICSIVSLLKSARSSTETIPST
jgi:hypothetical protein